MREVDEDLMKRFRDLEASQEKLREQLDLLICGGGDKKAERGWRTRGKRNGDMMLMAGNFVRNPYQAVLHQLGHALHICRPVSGEIIYWNRSAENLFGWKSYEALGQKITDLLIDINRYPCWESTLERVYYGQTWSGQFPFKKRSGELFMAMLTMSPLNESGICIGVITVSSDASMLNNGSSEGTWTHSDEAVGEFGEPKSNFKKVHRSPQLQIASSVSNLVQGPDNARESVKDNAYCASCYRNVVVQKQSSSVSDINSTEEMRNLVSQLNRSTSFAHFRNAIMHNTALHRNGEHLPDDATDKATVLKKNASTKMEDFQPAKSQNSMETSCSSQTGSSTVCEMESYLVADSEINWEDLLLGEKVGEGSYAVVYRGIWNGSDVAVKVYTGMDYQECVLLDYKKEIAIMKRLRHPNVLLFMGAVYSPEHLAIVTEYLPRGSLFRALHKNNQSLVLRRRVQMALDVARGMNYLHRRNPPIIHRDLKSSNLLVDKNWTVKVLIDQNAPPPRLFSFLFLSSSYSHPSFLSLSLSLSLFLSCEGGGGGGESRRGQHKYNWGKRGRECKDEERQS
ncbi:Serine/threonine-protein kinase CTR1 [Apostasia shenzhenica]|uniref:non-specific serine/threonine protein kinase n=1 Tax=Apostasia shenzhenica TaxID=1088818 RepID=A0A2H9ZTD1_9ASPA|nr:Serine/threonine-protein kinase CTR1 [Apostasia shenzhenica]